MKANQTANKIYQRAQAFYHSPILALGLNAGNCYHNSIIMEDVWNYGRLYKDDIWSHVQYLYWCKLELEKDNYTIDEQLL